MYTFHQVAFFMSFNALFSSSRLFFSFFTSSQQKKKKKKIICIRGCYIIFAYFRQKTMTNFLQKKKKKDFLINFTVILLPITKLTKLFTKYNVVKKSMRLKLSLQM